MKNETYILDCSVFENRELFNEFFYKMPEIRKRKIESYRFDRDRHLSLGAGTLLRHCLKGLGLGRAEIVYNKFGKPYIKGGGAYFNLSHSGGIAVCSISGSEVGVDIEAVSRVTDAAVRFVCTETEREYLLSLEETERKSEFFRLWTAKESFMKLVGTGISLPPGSLEICLGKTLGIRQKYIDGSVYFTEYPVDGCRLTVCSGENNFVDDLITLNVT